MASYETLKRGGYLLNTSIGSIQFGVPPETIKDTMTTPRGVPAFFVLPLDLFDWIKGISVAEIEFPLYFNYFVRKTRSYIICTPEQVDLMKRVLQESLFGPAEINTDDDFDESDGVSRNFDLKSEINHFRSSFTLDDLVVFYEFTEGQIRIKKRRGDKGVLIRIDRMNKTFVVTDADQHTSVPAYVDYRASFQIGERLVEPYMPPLFGITCLGPSHGFDPTENTSGFIMWLNHEGVMIDPPVDSTEWMVKSNINPKLIDSIILTHCHADHDAGTFQKILEEGRVTVYTTKTILMSFLRKYSAMCGMPVPRLMGLFRFQQIRIGEPVFIHGAKFIMSYSLHSIPTIAFRMEFQGKSFVYTSDHNNDPAKHRDLFERKIINERRYRELSSFDWNADLIYHESGIPPLHTPIAFLESLSEDVRKKIVVYHIAKKDFPENTLLRLAKFGIENTQYFTVDPSAQIEAYKILGILKHIDFFQDIPVHKTQDFLLIARQESYQKGEQIIQKDTRGDKFYIIYMGNVSVRSGDLKTTKVYGSYDYFGEVALITQQNRAVDVFAETNVVLYTIQRDEFLSFIAGTEFETTLKRLTRIRTSETWDLLSTSPFFKYCSATQKTWLESMFVPVTFDDSGVIMSEGEPIGHIYIIRSGTVQMTQRGKQVATLSLGDVIGDIESVYHHVPAEYTFTHSQSVLVYAMPHDEIRRFAERNPGLLMKVKYSF